MRQSSDTLALGFPDLKKFFDLFRHKKIKVGTRNIDSKFGENETPDVSKSVPFANLGVATQGWLTSLRAAAVTCNPAGGRDFPMQQPPPPVPPHTLAPPSR